VVKVLALFPVSHYFISMQLHWWLQAEHLATVAFMRQKSHIDGEDTVLIGIVLPFCCEG